MVNRALSVFLVGLLLTGLFAVPVNSSAPSVSSSPFADVSSDHPQAQEFSLLRVLGIFEGYPDGQVRPGSTVNRLQFAKMAVCMADARDEVREVSGQSPDFVDGGQISPVWWGWVNISRSLGLLRGYEDGTFRPRRNITYAEAVAVLLRVAGYEAEVAELDYPHGYIRKAHQVGLTEGVELAPHLPITRYEMAVLSSNALRLHPPDEQGRPADDPTGEYRPSRLENWSGRIEGVVSSISGDTAVVDGDEHTLAGEVYLFGADSLAELEEQWIVGFADQEGSIAYIETVDGPVELAGEMQDIRAEDGILQVDDRWFRWVPDADGRTTWQLNGADVPLDRAVERLQTSLEHERDVHVQLVARGDLIEELEAESWDAELYVLSEPEPLDPGWRVPVGYVHEGGIERREIRFATDAMPPAEFPADLQSPDQLRPGHAITAAIRGGVGVGEEDPVQSTLFHRVRVSDRIHSGEVERVEADHDDDNELYFTYRLQNSDTISLSREHLLDAPRDLTLNELYRAEHLTLVVAYDGSVISVLDATIAGPRSKYVRILTVWKVEVAGEVRSAYIVVDEAGEAVTYELSHPSKWALFVDQSLEPKRDRLVRLEVDESGRCNGVVSWVAEEPLPGEYVVSYIDEDEHIISVRRLRGGGDHAPTTNGDDRPREVMMATEAAVYRPDGEHVDPESLSVGQRVKVYLDEEDGEVGLLEMVTGG